MAASSKHLSEHVARNVRRLRRARRWTSSDLASRMADVGCPLTQPMVANIETGRPDAAGRRRRDVSADELFAFARVFGVPVEDLVAETPQCGRCAGSPPAGFACTQCGAVGADRD